MWPRLELSDATLQIRLVSRDYTRYTQFSNTYWGMNIAAESDIFEARKGRLWITTTRTRHPAACQ